MGSHRERPQRATLYAIGQSQSLKKPGGMPKPLPIGINPTIRGELLTFYSPEGDG